MRFGEQRGHQHDGAREYEAPRQPRRPPPAHAGEHGRDTEDGQRLERNPEAEQPRRPRRGAPAVALERKGGPHHEGDRDAVLGVTPAAGDVGDADAANEGEGEPPPV